MTVQITTPDTPTEVEAVDLSVDAKILLATMFGVGCTSVTFGMKESRPTKRAQAALDEMVEKGALSVADSNGYGGKTYKPLIHTLPYFSWLYSWPKLGRGSHEEYLRDFRTIEPIS